AEHPALPETVKPDDHRRMRQRPGRHERVQPGQLGGRRPVAGDTERAHRLAFRCSPAGTGRLAPRPARWRPCRGRNSTPLAAAPATTVALSSSRAARLPADTTTTP